MTGFGFLFALVTAGLLFSLPRRWSALPLLIAAAYVPGGQQVEIGPFHFTVLRILIAVGILRTMGRGERIAGPLTRLDKLVILWGIWLACSSVFHADTVFITRLGTVFDSLGVYFLFRVFLRRGEDIKTIFKVACVLFIPLAAAMVLERITGKNYFALLGGTTEEVLFRQGHFRAKGPFEHPILAGTVGAVCLPMALYLLRQNLKLALVGLAATGGIIVASSSSGPIVTAASILGAMGVWKIRKLLRAILWLGLCMIVALSSAMKDPWYYLIARVDFVGGSTGWYRAGLIGSAIDHFNQWWLAGTDFTRGWMHVSINMSNSDITDYYIQMGVWGGMPLMLLFMAVLLTGFGAVGRALHSRLNVRTEREFMIWTLGSILFGHVMTFFSISYFDQTFLFLYLVLAMIASMDAAVAVSAPAAIRNTPRSLEAV
jgi:hypothetical protein